MLDLKDTLEEGEQIEMIIKKHWIIYVGLGLFFLGGLVSTAVIFGILGMTSIGAIVSIIFWTILLLFLYIEWLNFEIDILIVTNHRVIGVDQISFLNISQSECELKKIEEVNVNSKGLLANLCNYGSISLQTAGSTQTMEMDLAPDVGACSRKIHNIARDSKKISSPSSEGERDQNII